MRLFAVSDLHVDYAPNVSWIRSLSTADYRDDVLIVAGDLSHRPELALTALAELTERFATVLFVPGNHDIWVSKQSAQDSLGAHDGLLRAVQALGIETAPIHTDGITIVPMLSWYDFSFGEPERRLQLAWMDFHRCRWPTDWQAATIAAHFLERNPKPKALPGSAMDRALVTFSHFMPRADLLPQAAVTHFGFLLPVLGGWSIDRQLRTYSRPSVAHWHVYGHSHVNVDRTRDGVRYLNNARGYPNEPRYGSRRLLELELPAKTAGAETPLAPSPTPP